jgi:hypothetical protein
LDDPYPGPVWTTAKPIDCIAFKRTGFQGKILKLSKDCVDPFKSEFLLCNARTVTAVTRKLCVLGTTQGTVESITVDHNSGGRHDGRFSIPECGMSSSLIPPRPSTDLAFWVIFDCGCSFPALLPVIQSDFGPLKQRVVSRKTCRVNGHLGHCRSSPQPCSLNLQRFPDDYHSWLPPCLSGGEPSPFLVGPAKRLTSIVPTRPCRPKRAA